MDEFAANARVPAGSWHATRTSTSLLEGLKDLSDQQAWGEFDRRYRPIMLAVARRLGLSDADAADVAQETVLHFVRDYRAGRFDPSRGRLRHWIAGIARHRIGDIQRRAALRGELCGASAMAELPDEDRVHAACEQAWREAVLKRAVDELRSTLSGEKSLAVLELLFIRQMSAGQVAAELGMTPQDVYVHKSRLARRLREFIAAQEALMDEAAA